MVQVLTLNAGSSSLKFALFEAKGKEPVLIARGQIEALGTSPHLIMRLGNGDTLEDRALPKDGAHAHEAALQHILRVLELHFPAMEIAATGHRVVHGGPDYAEPVVLTPQIVAKLKELIPLAPLHQPHNLSGIAAAEQAFPDAVQIACFDTAFHRSHPWVYDTYSLPRTYYWKGVRRYGFHGLSFESVTAKLKEIAPDMAAGRAVIAHLGAGASMCAIRGGKSVATTMGFSPLDGLAMSTRCGQLDPAAVLYLLDHEGMTSKDIAELLYKKSGLKGLSGLSGDMRELEAAGTAEAEEAAAYFVCRVRHELGGLAAALRGLDAVVFCGGIGENSVSIRSKICEDMHWLGLELDEAKNARKETLISARGSRVKVFVIETAEEAAIARHALALIRQRPASVERFPARHPERAPAPFAGS